MIDFITMPSISDEQSKKFANEMTSLARRMLGFSEIEQFASTGWLPDTFFELLSSFYSSYDAYINYNINESDIIIKCREKCDRCCKQPVRGIYAFEVISIYREIRKFDDYKEVHNLFVDRASSFIATVKELHGGDEDNIPSNHPAIDKAHKMLAKEGCPCPLLKDGECRIYSNRPISCRMYLSLTEPSLCTTPEGKTFHIEPPKNADDFLVALSEKLNILVNDDLASNIVQFGFDRVFAPWTQ